MKIMGVDPGTWKTGAGIIEARGNKYEMIHCEVIALPKKTPLPERLKKIYHGLCELIKIYRPEIMALENIFYAKDLQAMIRIGEGRACAMLAASEHNVEVVEYLPTRVKQAVSGNGHASKEQIQQMVRRLLNLEKAAPSDASDALALAICHLHTKPALKLMAAAGPKRFSVKQA